MRTKRLEHLFKFIESGEKDPFIPYCIGIEYLGMGDEGTALIWFSRTYEESPSYLPVFYQLGFLQYQHGLPEKAEKTIKEGIELANSQGDVHTFNELRELWDDLFD